jgi:CDP-glycerol glycerophosphotransferase
VGATLDNITTQTHKNLEVILVLDAPTDGSEKIAAEFAAKDSRIKIIKCEKNIGPGPARNTGIAAATGDWIHFMDADDFISHDFYEVLFNAAKKSGADVAACCVFYERKPKQSMWYKKDLVVSGADKFRKTWVLIHGWAWRYLIRREFWNANKITFPALPVSEDMPAMVQMIHYANRVALCPNAWYFYKNRADSILNAASDSERERTHRESRARANAEVADFTRKNGIKRPSKLFLHIWSQMTKR